MTQHFLTLLSAVVGVSLIAGCRHPKEEANVPNPKSDGSNAVVFPLNSPQLKSIGVAAVETRKAPPLRLSGRLVWNEDRTVRIYAPFAGRVSRLIAQVGDEVKENASLAAIASPDFSQIQEDAQHATTDFSLAETSLARVRELVQIGAIPTKELKAAEADYARASATKERTLRRLASLGTGLGASDKDFILKSPLPGVVVEKSVNPGQEVGREQATANLPPLFTISDPTHLWLLLDVTETDLTLLKPGQKLTVRTRAAPEDTFTGQLDFISDSLDPATRTVKVRASVDNAVRRLKAELYVTAELDDGGQETLQIPSKAVFLLNHQHHVFAERGQGRFERVVVKLGAERGGSIAVLDGITPGTRLVTDGCLLIQSILDSGS